ARIPSIHAEARQSPPSHHTPSDRVPPRQVRSTQNAPSRIHRCQSDVAGNDRPIALQPAARIHRLHAEAGKDPSTPSRATAFSRKPAFVDRINVRPQEQAPRLEPAAPRKVTLTSYGASRMKTADAVAEILKREGVDFLIGYPVNPIIEAAARADIRTIMVRQERIGLHMADAVSRVTSADRIGVFAMQSGPGTENAFGGVAQAFAEPAR